MAKNVKEKYTGPKVTDTATFIQKARWVHGDKYDYSKSVYTTAHKGVEIVCRTHGSFWQAPSSHHQGRGCPSCGRKRTTKSKQRDTDWFIKKSQKAHGNKYDYSKTVYKNQKSKVVIICPRHGEFKQGPANHYFNKNGCPKCCAEDIRGVNKLSTNDFVLKAREVHGNRYDYNRSVYVGSRSKLSISCPEHGEFFQDAGSHLQGCGCPICAKESKRNNLNWFMDAALEIHGDKYSYRDVLYYDLQTPVKIHCKKHGPFMQKPAIHIYAKSNCPECKLENIGWGASGFYGTEEESHVYVLRLGDSCIKVGLAKDVSSRLLVINRQSGYSVEKLKQCRGKAKSLWSLEQKILYRSGLKKFYPEESFAGSTECLELSELPKVLQIIEDWEKNNEESFSEISWTRRLDT